MEEAKSNSAYMERVDALANARTGPLKHIVEKVEMSKKNCSCISMFIPFFLIVFSYDGYLM